MRKGGILVIFLALVLAAASVVLVQRVIPTGQVEVKQAFETAPVVVAAEDITFGTELTDRHLRVVEYPVDSRPVDCYDDPDSLLGQVTKVFLVTNEPIVGPKLSSKGGGLSVRIPPSLRASSVKVDEVSGVSGFVLPGDRVDVLVSVSRGMDDREPGAQIVLQDIEVLAAGTKTQTEGNQTIDVQQITLLTTPQQAEKLVLAQTQGKILLTLRNPADRDTVSTYAVRTGDILKTPKPVSTWRPAPKQEEPKPTAKKIIKGPEVTEEKAVMPESPGNK